MTLLSSSHPGLGLWLFLASFVALNIVTASHFLVLILRVLD